MGDRLKIFNVNSYSSFSRSNSIIYCSYLSCPHFFFMVLNFYHSCLWFFLFVPCLLISYFSFINSCYLCLGHIFHILIFFSIILLIPIVNKVVLVSGKFVPVVSWLNLFSNLFLTFMNLYLNHKISSWLSINTLSSYPWLRLVCSLSYSSQKGFNLYCWK